MNRIKEIISTITVKGWLVIGIIGLLLIAGVVFYVKNPTAWPLSIFSKKEEVQEQTMESLEQVQDTTEEASLTKEQIAQGKYLNDIASATAYVNNTQEVKVAVVMSDASSLSEDEKKKTCGTITFVTHRVAGPAVLTQTLKAMFAGTIVTDFTPGNIIPLYHPTLTLEKVLIEDGVAKIYLGGNFDGSHDGWCDASLAIAQIAETTKSFDTVSSVEIYQGDKKIN
jgi:spore germination protein GerM